MLQGVLYHNAVVDTLRKNLERTNRFFGRGVRHPDMRIYG